MDGVRFRHILKSKVYATKEDQSHAVAKDKVVDEFRQWVLDLRHDYQVRKSIGDYVQQGGKRTLLKYLGVVLPSRSVSTFVASCIKDVVLVKRSQQMTIPRVVSNAAVFCTWVNVPPMSLRSPFKLTPYVVFFGMPWREYKLFFGLTNFFQCNFVRVARNENRSLGCTAAAILLLDTPVDVLPSFPSLDVVR